MSRLTTLKIYKKMRERMMEVKKTKMRLSLLMQRKMDLQRPRRKKLRVSLRSKMTRPPMLKKKI